ncbi:MAG: UbiA family prenyltransferase [Nitrospirae bacterium]|nr:UbiA family prenyltransferase [Nitrospirota bacterium]MBI5694867.1 UbiA family prenyltransferase [Nitrospirota bacterium]
MIKFPHTVFALPFAFTGAILAADGLPGWDKILWITLAMVGARSGAMGMNRLLDAEIDARNPRTKDRAIPAGLLTKAQVGIFSAISFALLVYASYRLNPLCLKLSPVAIFVVTFYSLTKRFTCAAHLVLGLALAIAPIGAWIAIRGTLDMPALVLGGAVLAWVAGFDIFYALQDMEFDRREGLHSIPSYLGVGGSLWAARFLHVLTVSGLLYIARPLGLNLVYMAGVAVVCGMLLYEHMLLRNGDLTKLDAAFFNMNGYISLTVLVFTAAAVMI